jgi:hypothetical protein
MITAVTAQVFEDSMHVCTILELALGFCFFFKQGFVDEIILHPSSAFSEMNRNLVK